MTKADWLEVAALVVDLWPAQPWPAETVASSFELAAQLDFRAAIKAVRELAESGRDFAPPPGLVISQTKAHRLEEYHQLPTPDLTRDLTSDELERARLMAARLRSMLKPKRASA